MTGRTVRAIRDEPELRDLLGEPSDLVRAKIADRFNDLTRQFVDRSPFVVLAERPGNRLADSLRNVLRNPHVGLLFLVPGVGDTLRVNGRATIVTDEELLAPSAVQAKVPKLGLLVDVEEVFTHCSKAFLRAQLWDPSRQVDRSELPSSGEIHRRRDPSFDADAYDAERADRYARREGFY